MPLRPDSRIANTGRHPDYVQTGHFGGREPLDQAVREANQMAELARVGPPETPPAAREYGGIDDAVNMLGLSAHDAKFAREQLKGVVDDVRDMLSVTKALREGGIPKYAIPELLRAAVSIKYHRGEAISKAGMPEGSKSVHGGQPVVKRGGKWVPDTEGAKMQAGITAAMAERKKEQQGDVKRPRKGSQGSPPKPKGGPGAQAAGGTGGKAPPAAAAQTKSPSDRFKDIQAKARAAGKTIHIKGPDGSRRPATHKDIEKQGHTHDHLDALEQQLQEHVKDEIANGGEGQAGPPTTASPPVEPPPPQPAANEPPAAAAGEGATPPIPNEEGPHTEHRVTQALHDLDAKLDAIQERLDSPHQKAQYQELKRDLEQLRKKPTPAGLEWANTRVLSFLALVTGVALGAATGGTAGALAGGVHGEATKITPGQESVVMTGAKKVAEKVTGAVKPKPKAKEKEETKKSLRLMLTTNGRPVFVDPLRKSQAPGDLGVEIADPTEDVPEPTLVIPVGFRSPVGAEMGKASPPGGGWHPIPGGKKGGYRRKRGGKYEYWYPDGRVAVNYRTMAEERARTEHPSKQPEPSPKEKLQAALAEAKRRTYPVSVVAERIWQGTVHTAAEFPAAAHGIGKLVRGERPSKHEMEAIVSVGVMTGTAVLAASTYGTSAAASAFGHKFATHVAMAALHSYLNTAYTGYAALGFVEKLAHMAMKADTPDGEPASEAEMKKLIEGIVGGIAKELDKPWTPKQVARIEGQKVKKAMNLRAPHPKNAFGHRDDLEPGMLLYPRERHSTHGPVLVRDQGQFEMGGQLFKGGHALLAALHGDEDHRTTVRRYFRLGGERHKIATMDVLGPLRALLKSEGVLVRRQGERYALTGDLVKAGVPEYMIPTVSPQHTVIDAAAAFDLTRYLSKEG